MAARYLIRFDDLCPTMDWEAWAKVEWALLGSGINPLLAVVPDNRDESLQVAPPRPSFWDEVRLWQDRGWTIGWHGYQHRFVTGDGGIVGLHRRSEFAGLPRDEQEEKLRLAWGIFRSQGVEPRIWIAPAHSFDWNTVAALRKFGVTAISDGFALAPHADRHGTLWVPQQLWRFRWRPLGTWTVCYHLNGWKDAEVAAFLREVTAYRPLVTDLSEVLAEARRGHVHPGPTLLDRAYGSAHASARSLRAKLRTRSLLLSRWWKGAPA